jgi:hypothetical protein
MPNEFIRTRRLRAAEQLCDSANDRGPVFRLGAIERDEQREQLHDARDNS